LFSGVVDGGISIGVFMLTRRGKTIGDKLDDLA